LDAIVKLEILIPTMPSRAAMLAGLLEVLRPQIKRGVRITTDDGAGSIGIKRQRMIDASKAEYVAFVDDDDMVAPDYVARILPCLKSKPDVVGITMHVTMDGEPWKPSPIFRHSLRFRENHHWQGHGRTPHHLCPLRRDMALKSRFPDMMWGEDYNYALGLLPHLQTEQWSGEEPIYFYNYVSKHYDPAWRGFDSQP
jgi:glycosyltransferase involved in cell wall biosynthesis